MNDPLRELAEPVYIRTLCKALDAALAFAGTVASGAAWWDDVWAELDAEIERTRRAYYAQPEVPALAQRQPLTNEQMLAAPAEANQSGDTNGRHDGLRPDLHGRVPLGGHTPGALADLLFASDDVMALNAELGLTMDRLVQFAQAVLAAAKAEPAGEAQDAARYRWLAAHCRSTPEHWGGRWSIVIEGPAPERQDCEDAFDAAIDAAMQAQEGGNV